MIRPSLFANCSLPPQGGIRLRNRLACPTAVVAAILLSFSPCARGIDAANAPNDLSSMTLEEVLNTTVTTVSKRPENLFSSAAAVNVITDDDIRRSGSEFIADALRLSPGLAVGRQDSHTWAISPRGFNNELASKLLVLMDGRSVYTPLNAGVYWDAQDTILDDIDRIEVIRGPGGTLWGANAVNGVINVLTKSARDTQGVLASAGAGSLEEVFGNVRYGGQLGDHSWFRVYGKYFERGDFMLPGGGDAGDSWRKAQGGFRIDWQPVDVNHFTLQGDYYEGREHQTRTDAVTNAPLFVLTTNHLDRFAGGNLLGRWTRILPDDGELKVQLYYDHTLRENAVPREKRDVLDFDLQHRFLLTLRQQIVWGLGYRGIHDEMLTNYALSFNPPERETQVVSAFLQDEITLVDNRLRFTLGTKVEHNDYTGWEVQPSARLAWTPTERQTVWAAVSRAVRTPSRAEDDVRINRAIAAGTPLVASLLGDRSAGSEQLLAYELGYRVIPAPRVTLDVVGFYHQYEDLRTVEPGPLPAPPPTVVAAFYSAGLLPGESYGIESAAAFQATAWWRLQASYTFLKIQLHPAGSGIYPTEKIFEDNEPVHQFSLRSSMDLLKTLQLDCFVRYVDELRTPGVASYVSLDVRLAWRPCKNAEISLTGQSLLDRGHTEFVPVGNIAPVTEVPRSIFGKVTFSF